MKSVFYIFKGFSSYNTQLLIGQPGTLLKEFSNLNGYNPKKNAVVSLSALSEMIHIFIVDIVALALAKEKIQKIVEREWQDSHLSRGRKSMARWLGVGREQLSSEDLSSISKSELDGSESNVFKPNTENKYKAQPKNISDSKFTKLPGISDFESAFNSSSRLENCSSEIPKIIPENLGKQGAEKKQKSSNKKKKKNPNLPDKTDERQDYNQTSEVVESSQNWLPDLSGWDVSYGFPHI